MEINWWNIASAILLICYAVIWRFTFYQNRNNKPTKIFRDYPDNPGDDYDATIHKCVDCNNPTPNVYCDSCMVEIGEVTI